MQSAQTGSRYLVHTYKRKLRVHARYYYSVKDISFNQETKHGPSYTETMDKTTPEMRIPPLIRKH